METYLLQNKEDITRAAEKAIDLAGGIDALAEKMGVNSRTIFNWKNGSIRKSTFSLLVDFIQKNEIEGVKEEPAIYGATKPIWIPYFKKEPLSMGGGTPEVAKTTDSYLAFRKEWLENKGLDPHNLGVFRASGDSMLPTIPDPSAVLIDMSQNIPVDNKIYMIIYDGEVLLKRLSAKKGVATHIVSDGYEKSEDILPGIFFKVIGRAVWYGTEL